MIGLCCFINDRALLSPISNNPNYTRRPTHPGPRRYLEWRCRSRFRESWYPGRSLRSGADECALSNTARGGPGEENLINRSEKWGLEWHINTHNIALGCYMREGGGGYSIKYIEMRNKTRLVVSWRSRQYLRTYKRYYYSIILIQISLHNLAGFR